MEHHRTLTINNQEVKVKHTDYDYKLGGETIGRFNITLQVELGGQNYCVCFTNVTADDKELVYQDKLRPCGEDYERFLQALETDPYYKQSGQYRDSTYQQAENSLVQIAEAFFLDVRAHSPDQDEE